MPTRTAAHSPGGGAQGGNAVVLATEPGQPEGRVVSRQGVLLGTPQQEAPPPPAPLPSFWDPHEHAPQLAPRGGAPEAAAAPVEPAPPLEQAQAPPVVRAPMAAARPPRCGV